AYGYAHPSTRQLSRHRLAPLADYREAKIYHLAISRFVGQLEVDRVTSRLAKKPYSVAEQHRHHMDHHFVHQPRLDRLPGDVGAEDHDVLIPRRFGGRLDRGSNISG